MATGMHTKLKYLLLLLLLSSLVTLKVFAIQHIDIATEQSFRYLELTDAKIWIFKTYHYDGLWQIQRAKTLECESDLTPRMIRSTTVPSFCKSALILQ